MLFLQRKRNGFKLKRKQKKKECVRKGNRRKWPTSKRKMIRPPGRMNLLLNQKLVNIFPGKVLKDVNCMISIIGFSGGGGGRKTDCNQNLLKFLAYMYLLMVNLK